MFPLSYLNSFYGCKINDGKERISLRVVVYVAVGDSASCRNSKRGFGAPWPQFLRVAFFLPIHFPLLMQRQRAGVWKKKEREKNGPISLFHVQVQLRLSSHKRVTYPSLYCMLPIATAAIGGTHAEAARSKANERRSEPNKTKVKLLKNKTKRKRRKLQKRENGNSLQYPSGFPIYTGNNIGAFSYVITFFKFRLLFSSTFGREKRPLKNVRTNPCERATVRYVTTATTALPSGTMRAQL